MTCWLETTAVIFVAFIGVLAGHKISRLRSPHWIWGYFLPLLLIAVLHIAARAGTSVFVPALACISTGRARFVIVCVAVTVGSMTLCGRLKRRLEKAIVVALMAAVVLWSSVLPFLVPALIKGRLQATETQFGENDICFQTTSYTCGPAAAVTALRQLGLSGEEGQLAILSHTSPVAGTLPWCLYKTLQDTYGRDGLKCELKYFDTISEVPADCVTLAIVKDAFMLDHCVAILDVGEESVVIGDPVLGRRKMSHKQFEKMWRFYGIVMQRPAAQSS